MVVFDRALGSCGHVTMIDGDVPDRWFAAPDTVKVKCTVCGRTTTLTELRPKPAIAPRSESG